MTQRHADEARQRAQAHAAAGNDEAARAWAAAADEEDLLTPNAQTDAEQAYERAAHPEEDATTRLPRPSEADHEAEAAGAKAAE